jgi:16S rRNA (adenine1518-N6/adenine1519-N6)-dimethyltransferase
MPANGVSPAMRNLAGFRPHKSKGQNFLTQPRIADRIAAAARLDSSDDVIEIGPGLGILSEAIFRHGVHSLTMIELDMRLATVLQDRMRDRRGVNVINADFLDLRGLPGDGPLKVVANLPFNVASAILERLCADHARITLMVLMFQREVAERIRARPGDSDYGALSVYTALYWNVTDHFRVAAGNFNPQPKVDAEVLVFTPRRPPLFEAVDEQTILRTIRAAFTQPRKTLRNSLASGLGFVPATAQVMLECAGIDPLARAATLHLEDFLRLARQLASGAAKPDAGHA